MSFFAIFCFSHLMARLYYDKLPSMKTPSKKNLEKELRRLAEAFPLAKGSLTATHSPCTRKSCRLCAEGKGHAKLIFTYRDSGKLRGLYVRPGGAA